MELTDLELCKKIAEIEGLTVRMIGNVECMENLYSVINSGYGNGRSESPFWPLIDKTLLFDLAVEYRVSIDHDSGEVGMWSDIGTIITMGFTDGDDLPRAILECIVEARNA